MWGILVFLEKWWLKVWKQVDAWWQRFLNKQMSFSDGWREQTMKHEVKTWLKESEWARHPLVVGIIGAVVGSILTMIFC